MSDKMEIVLTGDRSGYIITPDVTYVYLNGIPGWALPLCQVCKCCVFETRGWPEGEGICTGDCAHPELRGHPILSVWQCNECGFWAGPWFHPSNACDRYPQCMGQLTGPHNDAPGPQGHFTEVRYPYREPVDELTLALPF